MGFQQAVSERTWPFTIIGALADPEIEAWIVAAWVPDDDPDRAAFAEVRRRIGFDPTAHPERLTSKNSTDKKDAKRVLAELCARGRTSRERWLSAAWDERLMNAGAGCGLSDFIHDVRRLLLPLFAGSGSRTEN